MDEKVQWLKGQIEDWKKKQIVDEETAKRINNYYLQQESKNNEAVLNVLRTDFNEPVTTAVKENKPAKNSANTAIVPIVLSVISAVLIGAGVISLIAYNWAAISRVSKTIWAFIIALLPAALLNPSFINPDKKGFLYKKITKELLASLWVILAGGAIEFLCQIYLLPMTWPTVFLLWFIISLLVFLSTKSYGAHGLTAVLLAAYCISTKQIFPFVPVSTFVLMYGLKKKHQIFTGVGGCLVAMLAITLCIPEVWTNEAPVYSTVIFYGLTVLTILMAVLDAVKTKSVEYRLSTIIFPIVTGIFYIPYNLHLMETEAINASIVVLIIALIYTIIFSVFVENNFALLSIPVLLLLVCVSAFNYCALSILISVFMCFAILIWRESKYKDGISFPVYTAIKILLSIGLFTLLFQDNGQVHICNLTETNFPVMQLILMCIMGAFGSGLVVQTLIKHIKTKQNLIPLCEVLFLFFTLFGLILYSYFGKVDSDFFQPVIQICVITLMFYGTAKVLLYKNHSDIIFIVTGLLSLFISDFSVVESFNLYGPYFIFIFSQLGLFLQNKSHREKSEGLNNFGKVLFALALFIGIFEVYNVNRYNYQLEQLSSLDYLCYNLSLVFVLAFSVLRTVLISIKNKKILNPVMPVFGLFIFIFMILAQADFMEHISEQLNRILPVVVLLFVVAFSIFEIINWVKKDSVAGVNVSAIYLLLTAFVKFFMSTNDLIARGVAFIFCGVVVLVTNAVLSNYIKSKGDKHEN